MAIFDWFLTIVFREKTKNRAFRSRRRLQWIRYRIWRWIRWRGSNSITTVRSKSTRNKIRRCFRRGRCSSCFQIAQTRYSRSQTGPSKNHFWSIFDFFRKGSKIIPFQPGLFGIENTFLFLGDSRNKAHFTNYRTRGASCLSSAKRASILRYVAIAIQSIQWKISPTNCQTGRTNSRKPKIRSNRPWRLEIFPRRTRSETSKDQMDTSSNHKVH